MSPDGNAKGYLELAWVYPTRNQNGTYTCEAHGLDKLGRDVIFTAVADVDIKAHPADQLIDNLTSIVEMTRQQALDLNQRLNATVITTTHIINPPPALADLAHWPHVLVLSCAPE